MAAMTKLYWCSIDRYVGKTVELDDFLLDIPVC